MKRTSSIVPIRFRPVRSVLIRRGSAVLLVGLAVLSASCISLRIPAAFPGENRLDRMVICASVTQNGNIYIPQDMTSDFRLRDGRIICHIHLNDISREIRLRWRWYDPLDRIVRDTEDLLVNTEELFLSDLTTWDELALDPGWDETKIGTWTVAFSIEGTLAATLHFRIARD